MRELVTNVKDVNSALKLAGTALDIFSKVSFKTVITDVKQVGTVLSKVPQALKQMRTSVKAISFKDMTTGINSAGTAMKSLTGVIGTGTKALQALQKVLSTFFGINASVKETTEALESWSPTTLKAIEDNIMYQKKGAGRLSWCKKK